MTSSIVVIEEVPVVIDGENVSLYKSDLDDDTEVIIHPDYDSVYHLPFQQNHDIPKPYCRPIEYVHKARAPSKLVGKSDRELCDHCRRKVLDRH